MVNKTEKKAYLKNLLLKVDSALNFINERIQSQSDEVKYLNNHLSEHKRDMDHLGKHAMREAVTNTAAVGDQLTREKDRRSHITRSLLRNMPDTPKSSR